jgi:hypothetical protein
VLTKLTIRLERRRRPSNYLHGTGTTQEASYARYSDCHLVDWDAARAGWWIRSLPRRGAMNPTESDRQAARWTAYMTGTLFIGMFVLQVMAQ